MEEIVIKPHHFMDIIKLYGSGIEVFVPDEKMDHDFYRVANTVINNPDVKVRLTIDGDDICKPCQKYRNDECKDSLDNVPWFKRKNEYNRALDQRLIEMCDLDQESYTAKELCSIFFRDKVYIYKVWMEEDMEVTDRRYDLFVKGAKKYLNVESYY